MNRVDVDSLAISCPGGGIRNFSKLSKRAKAAALGGLLPFLKDEDHEFLFAYQDRLPQKALKRYLVKQVLRYTDEFRSIVRIKKVEEALGLEPRKMDTAEAISLFYTGNYSEAQWEHLTQFLNPLMDSKLRKKVVGFIPSMSKLKRCILRSGAKLSNSDLKVIEIQKDGDLVDLVDMTLDDDEDEGESLEVKDAGDGLQSVRGVYVKDVMNRLVVPEVLTIKGVLPEAYELMCKQGRVDIALAIDNTARPVFDGSTRKLEQAVIKVLVPGVDSAQQSHTLAMPIFFMDGDETYDSLKTILQEMASTKSLSNSVEVDGTALDVHWHLCADHKLVALVAGMGGSGCNKPCPHCEWLRTDPFREAVARNDADLILKSEWANNFLEPLHKAEIAVKKATQNWKDRNRGKPNASICNKTRESQLAAKLEGAKSRRATALRRVAAQMVTEVDPSLARLLNSAAMLQSRVQSLARKHFRKPTPPYSETTAAALVDLPLLRARISAAKNKVTNSALCVAIKKGELEQLPPESCGEMEHDELQEDLEDAEATLEEAEATLSAFLHEWNAKVSQVNALDGLVVKVTDTEDAEGQHGSKVEVVEPALHFQSITIAQLRDLLVDACSGIYRRALITDLLPSNRRYIESLHLVLNTGNSLFELTRNCFQYLITAEGEVRKRNEEGNAPDSWKQATSSSRQDPAWRAAGFDFEKLVELVLSFKRPLTKYHGAQIGKIFMRQDALWNHESLREALAGLKKDSQVSHLVADLKTLWEALALVHQQVQKATPDMQALKDAVDAYRKTISTFVDNECIPAPCRYRIKYYDHAIMEHVVPQSEMLLGMGLSLGKLSSTFLEANNKAVKAVMRRLPGGGQSRASNAHLPLVQAFKKCSIMSQVARVKLYASWREQFFGPEEQS